MKIIYVSVDCGVNGGIAHQIDNGVAGAVKMPRETKPLKDHIDSLSKMALRKIAVVEQVGAWVGDDPKKKMGIQKLRDNYTTIKIRLIDAGFEVIDVSPRKWMGDLYLERRGESKKDRKNRLKMFAASMFPHLKVTLNTADALCLLVWMKNGSNEV